LKYATPILFWLIQVLGLCASLIGYLPTWNYTGMGWLAILALPTWWALRFLANGFAKNKWQILPATALDLPIAILFLMVCVSIFVTYNLQQSLGKVLNMFFCLHWYYFIVNLAENRWANRLSLAGLVGALLGFTTLGILLYAPWQLTTLPQLQALASQLNPNELAGTMVWLMPPLIALAIAGGVAPWQAGKKRLWHWFALLVSVIALAIFALASGVLYWTRSRSAWIGMALGFAFMALWWFGQKLRWWSLVLPILLAIGALVFALMGGVQPLLGEANQAGGTAIGELAPSQSLAGRLELWSRGIYAIEDFPLTGMGMNTFRKLVHILYPVFSYAPTEDFGHAHNLFIQVGVDLGLPGLVAYLAMGLGCVWLCWQVWQTKGNLWGRWVVLGLLAGLVAHAGFGMTDAVALGAKPGFIGWWVVGMVVATSKITS
jgi:putative inorganic carbon (HCO3(-)) transporter